MSGDAAFLSGGVCPAGFCGYADGYKNSAGVWEENGNAFKAFAVGSIGFDQRILGEWEEALITPPFASSPF